MLSDTLKQDKILIFITIPFLSPPMIPLWMYWIHKSCTIIAWLIYNWYVKIRESFGGLVKVLNNFTL